MLIATITLFLAGLPAVVYSFIGFQSQTRGHLSHASSNLGAVPHADLTPAVDKYVRLPSGDFYKNYPTQTFGASWMTRKSSPPSGPDPFQIVHDELKPLSDYVKELLASENPVLTMAATHFFQQVSFDPYELLLVNPNSCDLETREAISTNNCFTDGASASTL